MRESVFVRRHGPAWAAFENRLDAGDAVDPDALAQGYVRLTDDLAYARTFYAGSATVAYLNGLAADVHHRLYRNRREERGRIARFWAVEVPLVFFAERRALAASLAVFALAVLVGVLSAANDETFVRLILGDGYVNMTLQNIEDGDPMRVYKEANEVDMTASIALNNVLVSFFAFTGLLPLGGAAVPAFSLGTAVALFRNGVMLGAFQYFFYEQGVFWESVQTIWIHGTIEIAAIIVAGGAGFAMGNALLFPGTYPRLVAFRRGAMRGMKMAVGLVPVFVFAALLEGFVTRYTAMPVALSVLVILASAGFVAWYFVLLPRRVHRRIAGPPVPAQAPSPASAALA